MRILFMDTYFPGFFRFLVPYVSEQLSHDEKTSIVFLSEHKRRGYQLQNVRHVSIRYPKVPATYSETEQMTLNSVHHVEAFTHAMQQLKKEGFYPDIVISTETCSTQVQTVFPDACTIVYFDWYYNSIVDDLLIAKGKTIITQKRAMQLRNAFQLSSLLGCYKAIVPSQIQKETYPRIFEDKMHVLPMGVDARFFHDKALLASRGDLDESIRPELLEVLKHKELITYSSRQLSEYAGFSTVCHSLPRILAARPQSHVVLVTHNVQAAMEHPNCAEIMKIAPDRIHILAQFTWNEYCLLMSKSSAHIYMSARPPLPTSLLEAMSCGALIVASDTRPVRALINHRENGLLADFFSVVSLSDMVIQALEMSDAEKERMRHLAQKLAMEKFAAQKMIPLHFEYIIDTFKNMTLAPKPEKKQL